MEIKHLDKKTNSIEKLPKILYKYREFKNLNHKNLILKQETYFSKPSGFNCEYDTKYIIDKDYVKNELNRRKYYKKHFNLDSIYNETIDTLIIENNLTDEWIESHQKERMKEYDKLYGIFSSSETYLNHRLWEVFGDKNKGFCVGIDFLSAFPEDYGTIKSKRINYVEIEDLPKNKALDIEGNDDFIKEYQNWLFTLPLKYIEEKEFRISKIIQNETARKRIIPKQSIKEIIIGQKMSKTDQNKIIEIINLHLPQTKIKKLKYSKIGYEEVIIK